MRVGTTLPECPVTGCEHKRLSPRYAVCMHCWRLVPVPLRDRIRGYWGELRRASANGTPEQERKASLGMAEAKRAAVDAVEARRQEARAA